MEFTEQPALGTIVGSRYRINGLDCIRSPMPEKLGDLYHSEVPPTIEAGINIDRQGGRTSVYDPDSAPITDPMVDIADARAHGRVWHLEPFVYERRHVSFTNLAVYQRNPENEDQVGVIIRMCERDGCFCMDDYHETTGELTRKEGTRGNVKGSNGQKTRLFHPLGGDANAALPVRRAHYRLHPGGHGDHPIAAATTPNVNETLSLELLAEAEAEADAEADD